MKKGKITKLVEAIFWKGCCDDRNVDDEPTLSKVLPEIVSNLNKKESNIKTLRCLYQLCNEKNGINRIAMLCCYKWDVLHPLIWILIKGNEKERHLTCLILANLSIPFENKAVMALGNESNILLSALYDIIHQQSPEAYIACICLANMTFLKDALEPVFMHTLNGDKALSGCRVLEKVIQTCPFPPTKPTVQGEAIRWICVILKHCSVSENNCNMIAKTSIPSYIVGYLYYTKKPLIKWTDASVEDSSLQIILHLCQWSKTKEILKSLNTVHVLQPIIGKGGIHDYRAVVITCNLEV